MSAAIERLADLLQARSGIRVSSARHDALEAVARQELGATSPEALLAQLAEDDDGGDLLDRLIDAYTIKETSFLRDADQLREIDWHGLLRSARAQGRENVHVWSAACATGEEPYTLALLAAQAFATLEPPVRVLGTDISRVALARALRACYQGRSLRNLAPATTAAAFERADGGLTPAPSLRRLVGFARHNLARASRPPAGAPFDLVVCRNVLIYFDRAAVDHAVGLLRGALAGDGMLLLGATDRLCLTLQDRGDVGPVRRTPPRSRDAAHPRASRRRRHAARRAPSERSPASEATVADAVARANAGDLEAAIDVAGRVAQGEPLNAAALYVHGLALLTSGDARAAVRSLRAAQYADPEFALAAFTLGRAHDALAERAAARRAYQQALRTFDPDATSYQELLGAIDVGDLAAACRRRLEALRAEDAAR